jgi:TolA-binding protein
VAAALSVAAAVLLWQLGGQGGASASFAVGDGGQRGEAGAFVAAPADRELPLRFDDGTRVALAAGTSARVASLDGRGAHIVLEKGRAVASVVHRPDSRWRVDVGPFQVAVVGTRFDVSWDASARVLELRLDEGAVMVSGGLLGDALTVRAGQRLRAFADDARVELSGEEASATPAVKAPSTDAVAPGAEPPASVPARAVPVPSVTWQSLASAGKFREALAAAEKSGFEAECARASGQELLGLGDAARLAGSIARAEQAYTAARGKLPGGGRASYGLGLVAFDQRGDFASAARWFQTYLREQPSGSLRAEATGRLLESLHRAGRRQEARKLAEQYLSRYPSGAQAPLAQKLVR